jgi:hypothetical protein
MTTKTRLARLVKQEHEEDAKLLAEYRNIRLMTDEEIMAGITKLLRKMGKIIVDAPDNS